MTDSDRETRSANSRDGKGTERHEKAPTEPNQYLSHLKLTQQAESAENLLKKTFKLNASMYDLPTNYHFYSPELIAVKQEGFKQVLTRSVECGKATCESLQLMLSERASIEKQVAQLYQEWSNRWKHTFLHRSPVFLLIPFRS